MLYNLLMQRSIERLADLQKATLYVVSQQTADFNATMRKSINFGRKIPAAYLFDFTGTAVALEAYISEADKLYDMLLCSINEPETVTDRLALISQRDGESRAQAEYQRARKLLLHALSCHTDSCVELEQMTAVADRHNDIRV